MESAQAIQDTNDDSDDTIKVDGNVRNAVVVDNTHTVQVNVLPGNFATIRGRRFQLQQFHFHAPSEHTLNGVRYPLEAHFVYQAKDGRLAVLGVMFREGEANPAFTEIMQRVVPHGKAEPIASFDISRLLPSDKSYYHYLGSLTTPPLSQNLEWYVLPQPLTLSAMQIADFHRYYMRNNRDLQPRNNRELLYFADK
ncbi:MAG: carbonic anhydrase family protein [Herbaspirillum sp.]